MRKRLVTSQHSFFITVVAYERRSIFSTVQFCEKFYEIVARLRVQLSFRLFEHVLMPDHYHVILEPSTTHPLNETMRRLNGTLAREWNLLYGKTDQVFQHGYYDHAIRNMEDYREKARYIHDNPVRAGFVSSPEQYPWSSARARLIGGVYPIHLYPIQ